MKNSLYLASLFTLLFSQLVHAFGPARLQTSQSILIDAPATEVWQVLIQTDQWQQWHPLIASTQMLDNQMRLVTVDSPANATITEKIDRIDQQSMTLVYKIRAMSTTQTSTFNGKTINYTTLPVNNYKSSITLEQQGQQTKVTWYGKFYRSFLGNPPIAEGQTDEDAINAINDYYNQGLDGLKNWLKSQMNGA